MWAKYCYVRMNFVILLLYFSTCEIVILPSLVLSFFGFSLQRIFSNWVGGSHFIHEVNTIFPNHLTETSFVDKYKTAFPLNPFVTGPVGTTFLLGKFYLVFPNTKSGRINIHCHCESPNRFIYFPYLLGTMNISYLRARSGTRIVNERLSVNHFSHCAIDLIATGSSTINSTWEGLWTTLSPQTVVRWAIGYNFSSAVLNCCGP